MDQRRRAAELNAPEKLAIELWRPGDGQVFLLKRLVEGHSVPVTLSVAQDAIAAAQ